MAKTTPTKVMTPPKQIRDGSIATDGDASTAVIHKLIANNTKQINEVSKVLRDINPLDTNEKADTNKSIPNILVKISKIGTRYSLMAVNLRSFCRARHGMVFGHPSPHILGGGGILNSINVMADISPERLRSSYSSC
jgi:hypothetical protein